MATGTKKDALGVASNQGIQDKYNIAAAAMAGFNALPLSGDVNPLIAFWTGAGAITLTNYNSIPIGSIIIDTQAFKIHIKQAAATWKSSAAYT